MSLFLYWVMTIVVTLAMVYPIFRTLLIIRERLLFGTCPDDTFSSCHFPEYNENAGMLTCGLCGQGFKNIGDSE